MCDFGEVHIWSIQLDCAPTSLARLELALSPEERYRAASYLSPKLRNRWTVARGGLRHILAGYSQSAPGHLAFQIGPNGKPELARSAANIHFNLSHTRDLALLAITCNRRVGIDVEAIQPDIEIESLSRRFFARAEAEEILGLAKGARIAVFFACWTRKESFLKALGVGLSVRLGHFEVSVRADQPARLISVSWDRPDRWSLLDVREPGIAAALALEGPMAPVRRFNFVAPLT